MSAVHYQHPNLEKATTFMNDFGFVEARRDEHIIYYRGFGVDPYVYIAEQSPTSKRAFIGGIWTVASHEDLQIAAEHPSASTIQPNAAPGGGDIVTIEDPNGFKISFVHGQKLREKGSGLISRITNNFEVTPNSALEKHRQGQVKRFDHGPSPVHKVGHYGFGLPGDAFDKTIAWYTSLLNLKATDEVFRPSTGETITSFLHIDLGQEYTDHHVSFCCVSKLASSLTALPRTYSSSKYQPTSALSYITQATKSTTSTANVSDMTG